MSGAGFWPLHPAWKVEIDGQRPTTVLAPTALDAVLSQLSRLGLRYRDTPFRVSQVDPSDLDLDKGQSTNITPIKKGKASRG